MCFIKTSTSSSTSTPKVVESEPVEIHQADASLTKNNQTRVLSGYRQNFKTSAIGLNDEVNIKKNTLLGE